MGWRGRGGAVTGNGWSSREEGPDCACGRSRKALAGVQAGDRRGRTGVRVVPRHIHGEVDSAGRVIKQRGPKTTWGRWTELLAWAGGALPREGWGWAVRPSTQIRILGILVASAGKFTRQQTVRKKQNSRKVNFRCCISEAL